MLYRCTHMTTVGVKGFSRTQLKSPVRVSGSQWSRLDAAHTRIVIVSTQDRVDHVVEARLYVRDVIEACFRRRYTLFAENRVAVVTRDVDLHHSMIMTSL